AYYFAEKLQRTLNVPVGIIHNAVPGSPIESWLSEKTINSDSLIEQYGEKRWSDTIDVMVKIGKKQSLINHTDEYTLVTSKNKHPWMPTYNYTNGINPIKNFTIKGVIWYQGESNAEHYDFYPHMLSKMVTEWRNDFENDFPFYYVQLSSRGERPAWPYFRDMQAKMLDSVPNSGMVVISDVGDRDDTHAKNKKPVGERLALLALGKTYVKGNNYECPVFDIASKMEDEITVTFKGEFDGLKTSDGEEVRGFEISYDGLSYEKVDAYINGSNIVISMLTPGNSFSIRYGWESYTDANLVSGSGLPVSTFKYSN
ncbi:MAG: sialate O-acetylesterase, partial [Bacteroidota bacterium]